MELKLNGYQSLKKKIIRQQSPIFPYYTKVNRLKTLWLSYENIQ